MPKHPSSVSEPLTSVRQEKKKKEKTWPAGPGLATSACSVKWAQKRRDQARESSKVPGEVDIDVDASVAAESYCFVYVALPRCAALPRLAVAA